MSHSVSSPVRFTHYNDIHDNRAPCPKDGHELIVDMSHTSDTVSVKIDGEYAYTFDEGVWLAMLKAAEGLNGR